MQSIKEILPAVANQIDMQSQKCDELPTTAGIKSGIKELDAVIDRFQKGNLYAVVGYRDKLKTTFLMQVAMHVAISEKKPVVIFAPGESVADLTLRMIAQIGRIPIDELKTGQLHDNNWASLTKSMGLLNETKIFLDDEPINHVNLIRALHSLAVVHGELGLVILDNSNLVNPGKFQPSPSSFLNTTTLLNEIATQFNTPVLTSWRLNQYMNSGNNDQVLFEELSQSGFLKNEYKAVIISRGDANYLLEDELSRMIEFEILKGKNSHHIKLGFEQSHLMIKSYDMTR